MNFNNKESLFTGLIILAIMPGIKLYDCWLNKNEGRFDLVTSWTDINPEPPDFKHPLSNHIIGLEFIYVYMFQVYPKINPLKSVPKI